MATARPHIDESYNLRGLSMVLPDQITNDGDSPYLANVRMYSRDDSSEPRVAIRTRKGSTRITTAYGETLDTQNVGANTGDLAFSTTRIVAVPFTAGANGVMSRIALELKSDADSRGHVMVDICSSSSGFPGAVVATGSILSSAITSAYAYLDAYLMDAPSIVSGTQYWALLSIQDNGAGSYYVRQTANSTPGSLVSIDATDTWSALGASFRFKTYLSRPYGVKGFHRRYPSDLANRTLFSANTSMYSAQDNGTVTEISTAIHATNKVRFTEADDKTFWVDGSNNPKKWDGTTVSDIANAPAGASLIALHEGRLFFLTDKTRVTFSELYDFETYPSVNFFYVPDPKSSDPVTWLGSFQGNLVCLTHETKHIVYGTDISTFDRRPAIGTKGSISHETVAVDRNYIYFMGDDKQIYAWAGGNDILLSEKVEKELAQITNPELVRFHLYRNQLRVYYPSPGSLYNNRMLLLDLTYSNWSKQDFQWFLDTGRNVAGSLEWNQDDENNLIEFSSRTPQMYRGEQNFSDMGKPIATKYWTKYKNYGSGSAKKRVKRFRPYLRSALSDFTMQIGKDMDFADDADMRDYSVTGDGAKWGAFVWNDGTRWAKRSIVSQKSAMSGRGEYIQYRFERTGVETPMYLYGYIAQVKIGKPK